MASRVAPFDRLRVTRHLKQFRNLSYLPVTLSLSKDATREATYDLRLPPLPLRRRFAKEFPEDRAEVGRAFVANHIGRFRHVMALS